MPIRNFTRDNPPPHWQKSVEDAKSEFAANAKKWRVYRHDPTSPPLGEEVQKLLTQGVGDMMHNFLQAQSQQQALENNSALAPYHLNMKPGPGRTKKLIDHLANYHRLHVTREIVAVTLREDLERMPQICAYAETFGANAEIKKAYVCDSLIGTAIRAAVVAAGDAGVNDPHVSTTYFTHPSRSKPGYIAARVCEHIRKQGWQIDRANPNSATFDEKTLGTIHKGVTELIKNIEYIQENKNNIIAKSYHMAMTYTGSFRQQSLDTMVSLAESVAALNLVQALYDSPALAPYGQDDKDRIVKQLTASLVKASIDEAIACGCIDETKKSRFGIVPDRFVNEYINTKVKEIAPDEKRNR